MTLQEQGFRFMYIGDGEYNWIHQTDIKNDFIDCTDMTDEEFELFVITNDEELGELK